MFKKNNSKKSGSTNSKDGSVSKSVPVERFLKSLFKDKMSSLLVNSIKKLFYDISDDLISKFHSAEKKFLRTFLIYLFVAFGVIFIAFSGLFLLRLYFRIDISWSFFILGLGFLIISLVLALKNKRS